MEARINEQKITDLAVLRDYSKVFLEEAMEQHDGSGALVIALSGELGAGKTAFTQELAAALGISLPITSPTFVIMKRYETTQERFKTLVHIDAYRIEELDEMRVLGFERITGETDTIMCIEWAERIAELLPSNTVYISIDIDDDMSRTFTLRYGKEYIQEKN